MATHRIPIVGWQTSINGSGRIIVEPLDVRGTNDFFKQFVLSFLNNDGTAKDSIFCAFQVPANYVGGAKFRILWASATTTGNKVWDVDYRAVARTGESFDQATAQESVTVTSAAAGTAWQGVSSEMTPTASNFAADDLVEVILSADGLDAANTFTGIASVLAVDFEYSDT